MSESNSLETHLSDQAKFRRAEINKIKEYFISEIREGKTMSKKRKYIATFDYISKALIALSATSGGISIISSTTFIGVPAGIASASFALVLSLVTRVIRK